MITLKLKDISIGNKGFYGIGASSCKYEPSLPQYLRITDISDDSRISIPLPTSINVNDYPEYKDYFLNKNDIVFARTGNSTGRNYFYSGSLFKIVYAGFLIKFSIDPSKVNPRYVGYYCQSDSYWKQVKSLFTGSTRANANAQMYGELNIPILEKSLQQHIVNTIGSVDDLIEKYGLMEDKILSIGLRKINLLNSIRDNVSFSKYVTFDKGFEVGSSNYIEKPKNKDGLIPYLRVGDLDSLKDCYIEKGQSLKVCKADDTLIAFDGAPGRMNVGLIGAYSSGIYKVISQNKGFAFFELLSDLNQSIIKDNSQGTTILHASKAIPLLKACEITNDEVDYFERIYRLLVDIKVRKVKCRDIKSILLNKYFTN